MSLTGTADGTLSAGGQPLNSRTAKQTYHLCVCICTFKRAELLRRLLNSLASQRTGGVFTYSVVVADNDAMQSAQPVVAAFSSQSALPVTYCIEPQQNIALARNRAIEHADGDFVVFIDDDEFPTEGWLLNLLKNYLAYVEDDVVKQIKPY